MRHTPKLALSAVALGSALAAACGCARAEQEPNYESIESISVHAPDGIFIAPVIEVASDGNVYTQPTGTAHLSLVGEAKTSAKWRLADLHYGIGAMVANTGQLTGTNHSFGSFDRRRLRWRQDPLQAGTGRTVSSPGSAYSPQHAATPCARSGGGRGGPDRDLQPGP